MLDLTDYDHDDVDINCLFNYLVINTSYRKVDTHNKKIIGSYDEQKTGRKFKEGISKLIVTEITVIFGLVVGFQIRVV